jgi:hypothetical protein
MFLSRLETVVPHPLMTISTHIVMAAFARILDIENSPDAQTTV